MQLYHIVPARPNNNLTSVHPQYVLLVCCIKTFGFAYTAVVVVLVQDPEDKSE